MSSRVTAESHPHHDADLDEHSEPHAGLRSLASYVVLAGLVLFICWQGAIFTKSQHEIEKSQIRATLWKSLLQSTATTIIAVDGENGMVMDWNPAAEHLLGWGSAEAIGQPLDRVLLPRHRESHAAYIHSDELKARLEREVILRECQMVRKDGSLVDVKIQVRGVQGYHYVFVILADPIAAVQEFQPAVVGHKQPDDPLRRTP